MKRFLCIGAGLLLSAATARAGQQVGSVVALRGAVAIERSGSRLEAKIKSGVELQDTVQTAATSRAKLLFIDDSVLTLGDNSRMSIKEFIHSSSDRGRSIFNLLDGKMRAVVGKTKFQVETPTAIAAARGTVIYFEVGKIGNRYYTKIICLEGAVEVRSRVAGDTAVVELNAGNSIIIMEGEPLRVSGSSGNAAPGGSGSETPQVVQSGISSLPGGVQMISLGDQTIARNDTSIGGPEIQVPAVTITDIMPAPRPGPDTPPPVIPITGQQQPPVQPAGVKIQIGF
jgi:hypothetical protein